MSLFSTPSQMLCAALGRVGEDGNGVGEHEEEVWDEASGSVGGELNPVIEETVGGNACELEEPALDNSSLGRILDPNRYQDNNRDDVDISSFQGSVGSVGDLNLIGSFGHLGSKVNKKGRRQKGRGLSDMLGRELKIPLPPQKPNVVDQKLKFVLLEECWTLIFLMLMLPF